MANNGINWQVVNLPFSAGLNQKADDRARPQPFLDIARDVQLDEVGGIQTRLPYAAAAGSIFGGGTIANARRIVPYGNELVLFTDTSVYSWNAQLSKWVLRGTHLAVKVDERPTCTTTGDQVDGDRAELSGTVVFAWTEGTQVYAAALDKTTGSVLVSPTAVSTAIGWPRLVALATKILLFVEASATLLTVRAIDPAAPGTAITGAGTTVLNTDFNLYYDVVKAGTQDLCVGACRRVTTTSYTAFLVTPALAVTLSTKARTADGPVAIAPTPDGTQTQVIRANGTNIQGDLLTTSTLADVFTGQAIGTAAGTPVNQIAAVFTSSSSATAFWSAQEATDGTNFQTKRNTVTTANAVGTQANHVLMLGVASRAFEYGGNAYVWLVFAGDSGASGMGTPLGIRAQLQNTYFLYRGDGLLVSKAAFDVAGGYSPVTGHLPGVALVSGTTGYAWCGAQRRSIDLGGVSHTGFGARSPLDVTFTFDSNEARRCARIGSTLYITGGLIMQYDGVNLSELGFLVYPWFFLGAPGAPGTGVIAAGQYAYKSTMSAVNAVGEQERSTTATGELETANALSHIFIATYSMWPTLKTGRQTPAIEIWRTEASPGDDSPFYLVTSKDPTVLAGDNRYVPNDVTIFQNPAIAVVDNFTDATLTTKEPNPENGNVLENLCPPGASIVVATDTRIILAGVAGDPDRVWYSKLRGPGEVAAFHDTLTADVPRDGGAITAVVALDFALVVYRATAIYELPGTGLDNLGGGQNYGPARVISLDVGAVSQEGVAVTPKGTVFKSRKGWYLQRGADVQYIGDKVSDYDSETPLSIDVVETQHQVRILTANRMLVWDYLVEQWFEWTIIDGVHACMFGGAHVYLTTTGTRTQGTSYTGLTYGLDVETAPIKLADLQSASRVRHIMPLGEYRSAHLLRVRIAYNYAAAAGVPTYVDDKIWTPSPTTVGGPLQVKHGPKRPICESIKVRLTAVANLALATRATATLAIPVQTSGTNWAATFQAVALGELGNAITLRLAFVVGTGSIDVRDHFAFDPSTSTWSAAVGTIGVLVTGTPTVAQLEAAIVAGTALATLTIADATPTKVVAVATMAGLAVATGLFTGGTFTSPTGEALKLTSLGLEVGTEPGLFRRLPAAQQQ